MIVFDKINTSAVADDVIFLHEPEIQPPGSAPPTSLKTLQHIRNQGCVFFVLSLLMDHLVCIITNEKYEYFLKTVLVLKASPGVGVELSRYISMISHSFVTSTVVQRPGWLH